MNNSIYNSVKQRREGWWLFPPPRYAMNTVAKFEPFELLDMVFVNGRNWRGWSVHARRANGYEFVFFLPADDEVQPYYTKLSQDLLNGPRQNVVLRVRLDGKYRLVDVSRQQKEN